MCILVVVVVIIICSSKKERFGSSSGNVTVYILNYNRPDNIAKSIPVLRLFKNVDQIVVSHGCAEGYREMEGVDNIKDYENNDKYGAGRRFLIDLKRIKNDKVLVLDDDMFPSTGLYNRMLKEMEKDSEQIYGPHRRRCDKRGYDWNPLEKDQNVVLLGLAMTSKKVIKNFQDHFSEVGDLLERYGGNGEDLAFNYIFRKYVGKIPKYIEGDFVTLDIKNGYSSMEGHNDKRHVICKELV